MDPPRIFAHAEELGLSVIAVTDHNCTANLPAFLEDPPQSLWIIPGMELQTKEEVHLVCLFPTLEEAMACGADVDRRLPNLSDLTLKSHGEQTVLDRSGKTLGEVGKSLFSSIDLGLSESFALIRSYNGICYPAHVDRPSFGIIGQLGFIPPDLPIETVEISYRMDGSAGKTRYPKYQCIQSSDAHQLIDMGRGCSLLRLVEPTWSELRMALERRNGRGIEV